MSFIFASSHLPETQVQRPEDEEEEKDAQPKPSSGGVRPFSHLPQYAPSVARSAGTPPLTQPGNANLSHTQTLEYRTPDAQPGSHAKTLEYRMPHAQPQLIGSYQGGKSKPSPYLPDWLKPDTDHEDHPDSHEPPDLSPPLKPAPPNPRVPALVLPEWLQRHIDTLKKRPPNPDDDTPDWHLDGHTPGLRNDDASPYFPNPFGPSRNPKRRHRHPGFDPDPDQKPLPEGWQPQAYD